ncbi:hypothetical protein K4K60_005261 [Colletotrichum sp. SAR11_57]|nr:hypothetical protein K4K60_005261 [Colletotrichum sp. SAR11_57]
MSLLDLFLPTAQPSPPYLTSHLSLANAGISQNHIGILAFLSLTVVRHARFEIIPVQTVHPLQVTAPSSKMADIFPFIDETLDWCSHYVNRIETLRLMEAAAPPGNQQLLQKIASTKKQYMNHLAALVAATQMVLKTYTAHQRTAPTPRSASADTVSYSDTDDDDKGSTSAPSESEYFSATEEINLR